MSYLEGFISGFGKSAGQQADNMLNSQMKRYESAARIWEAMANDPGYHPTIREKFYQNARDLVSTDPRNRQSILRAKELAKLDPSKEASKAYEAMKMLGMSPEELKYRDPSSGYLTQIGQQRMRADFEAQQMMAKQAAERQEEEINRGRASRRVDEFFGQQNQWNKPFDMREGYGPQSGTVAPQPLPKRQLDSFDQKTYDIAKLLIDLNEKANLGPVLNAPNSPGGIVQTVNGRPRVSPAVRQGGQIFPIGPDGRPTLPEGPIMGRAADVDLRQGPGGQDMYLVPGMAPSPTGNVRSLVGRTTTTYQDKASGTTQTQTTPQYQSPPSSSPGTLPWGAVPPSTPSPTPTIPPPPKDQKPAFTPTPQPGTGLAPPMTPSKTPPSPAGDQSKTLVETGPPPPGVNPLDWKNRSKYTWPDKQHPSTATRALYVSNPVLHRKYDASKSGMSHVNRILDKVERFQAKFGNSPTGPIRGRIAGWLNEIGWAEGINKIAALGAQFDKKQISEEAYAAALDQINSEMAARAGTITGEGDAAEEFAGLVTLTRSLNGLELIAMSGSGNGITRLYEMMSTALLNPFQDPSIIRGHAREVGFLFSENIKNALEGRGEGWPDLSPDLRKALRRFQLADGMPGYEHWEPELAKKEVKGVEEQTVPVPSTPKLLKLNPRDYPYKLVHPKTKQRIWSKDNNNWVDADTGAPYRP